MSEIDLRDFQKRISRVEDLLENIISKNVSLAAKYAAEDDFETAAVNAGKAVEGLLKNLYIEHCQKNNIYSKRELNMYQLRSELSKEGVIIPKRILKNIDYIQYYRNIGAHARDEVIHKADLSSVLNSLLIVLEWYLLEIKHIDTITETRRESTIIKKMVFPIIAGLFVVAFVVASVIQSRAVPHESKRKPSAVLDGRNPNKIMKFIGQYVAVRGKIVNSRSVAKAKFLNFGMDWRKAFTAVIFQSSFSAFKKNGEPTEYYMGKNVEVRGHILLYKKKPEIILRSPEQIRVILSE